MVPVYQFRTVSNISRFRTRDYLAHCQIPAASTECVYPDKVLVEERIGRSPLLPKRTRKRLQDFHSFIELADTFRCDYPENVSVE